MKRIRIAAFVVAALLAAGLGGPARGAEDVAKELAKLEERFETTELDWQKAYKAFRPEYEEFAGRHPATEEALTAKLRLLQFSSTKEEDESVSRARAAAIVDEILAQFPRSPQLGRLPGMWYLFAEDKFREVMGKLDAADQPDAVKAGVAMHRARAYVERKQWDKAQPLLDLLTGPYKSLPCDYSTYGEVADALALPHADSALAVGALAPEIVGKDVDGKAIKLSDFKGRVVVLDFFGDW